MIREGKNFSLTTFDNSEYGNGIKKKNMKKDLIKEKEYEDEDDSSYYNYLRTHLFKNASRNEWK